MRRATEIMTVVAIILGAAAFLVGFLAILSAVGAYVYAQEISERIDALWGDMMDDELEELTRDEMGDE